MGVMIISLVRVVSCNMPLACGAMGRVKDARKRTADDWYDLPNAL
jgi:hypothetical protein